MKKAADYRAMTIDELQAAHQEQCQALFAIRCKRHAEKKADKSHLVRNSKKEIARLLTVLNEKQRADV